MQLKQEHRQRLEQKLVMTPLLQQSLKILQLPRLELQDYIMDELERNPVLEEVAKGEEQRPAALEEKAPAAPEGDSSSEQAPEGRDLDIESWQEYYGGQLSDSGESPGERGGRQLYLENTAFRQPDLREFLSGQLALLELPRDVEAAAREIIGDIDDDGYFRGVTLEDVAGAVEVPVPVAEKALRVVQSLEPIGVGARDLKECLLIQLHGPQHGYSRWAREIVEHCFEELETHNVKRIGSKLGINAQTVQRALNVITALEPKPGRQYSLSQTRYITPDLYVQREGDDYQILLNNESMPLLRLNPYYMRLLRQTAAGDGARGFLEEKLRSARHLIRSIDQRQHTLYKVAEVIFSVQRDFLDKGLAHLRPLKLSHVAQLTGLHESTVSRATAGKYAQTPRGLFELKYFFSPGLAAAAGGDVSVRSVRESIRELIGGEDKRKPYSDQKLAELFRRAGINVARRTVAKYREEMKVPAASRRKVF